MVLNRSGVYRVTPYVITGVVLWACVHAGGLHATLAGVLLAAFIPTRKSPDYRALVLQAEAILTAEASHGGEQFRLGPSEPALRELDAIHDRIESPADRLLRNVAPHSSYLVLPIFALANAGVVHRRRSAHRSRHADGGHRVRTGDRQTGGIHPGVVAGGEDSASPKSPPPIPGASSRGAGALAGIGFTMSLFIAGQAFPATSDFAAAKIAVFAASVLSAIIGVAVLWGAPSQDIEKVNP